MPHADELAARARFAFGKNWQRFLRGLSETRIVAAEQSLLEMLELPSLEGKRFLDIGSGSGLFSLAARRLGATVRSFDYDPDCVACTQSLQQRYFADDSQWRVESGSVLDEPFLESLGQWDIVYSWGVLHHTGAMYTALGNAAQRVAPGGLLFIALYNDQGGPSRRWLKVKRLYNRLPVGLRWVVLGPSLLRLWGLTSLRDLLRGRPFESWRKYAENSRGMSAWRDVVDWVGGLPFEVARPEEVFDFLRTRGFRLVRLSTLGRGSGCNQFVFAADP
jgi:2-polyprenyl-6-hydroxyphenyl methylase/3-demethylubiquinone-9 3-methyltransferase